MGDCTHRVRPKSRRSSKNFVPAVFPGPSGCQEECLAFKSPRTVSIADSDSAAAKKVRMESKKEAVDWSGGR